MPDVTQDTSQSGEDPRPDTASVILTQPSSPGPSMMDGPHRPSVEGLLTLRLLKVKSQGWGHNYGL